MSTESTVSAGPSAHIRRTQCREAMERAAAAHGARLATLASARLAAVADSESPLSVSTPRPGETYLSRATADFPVEWLVIDHRVDHRGSRCRVLPVDEFPLVGSEDFRFPLGALGGPQVGRCGFPTWLDADRFESDLCTGALPEPELAAVRHKLVAVESHALAPKPSEDEVDGDPEYHLWRDRTLRRAVAALDTEVETPPTLVPFYGAPPRRPLWPRPLAVAALFLLMLAPAALTVLHLMDTVAQERERVAALEQASESQAAELETVTAEKRRAGEKATRLETELTDLRQAMDAGQKALVQSFETRIATLQRELTRTVADAVESKIVENIPVLRLDHRSRRSRTSATRSFNQFQIGDKGQLILEVDVDDPEPYRTYEACLQPDEGTEFCLRGLTLQDGRFLRVALPVERLSSDDYTVTLKGEKRGTTTPLDEEYDVRIER